MTVILESYLVSVPKNDFPQVVMTFSKSQSLSANRDDFQHIRMTASLVKQQFDFSGTTYSNKVKRDVKR